MWTPPDVAVEQGGVWSAEQAYAAGYSPYRIRRLVDDGRWVQVAGSVYSLAAASLTPAARARAALLATQCEAVVSHTTAAGVWALEAPADPELHLIVPLDSRVRLAGVRTHRVPIADDDVAVVDGLLVTGLARTIVDCILWLSEEQGRRLALAAVQRGRVDLAELRVALRAVGRRHGVARARSVLSDLGDGAQSEMEVRVHRILRREGILGWSANAAVRDAAGLIGYVDLLFASERVVVELDGRAFHTDPDRFQRDRERQNRLVAQGYVVLRFTWDDVVHRSASMVAQIRAALRREVA